MAYEEEDKLERGELSDEIDSIASAGNTLVKYTETPANGKREIASDNMSREFRERGYALSLKSTTEPVDRYTNEKSTTAKFGNPFSRERDSRDPQYPSIEVTSKKDKSSSRDSLAITYDSGDGRGKQSFTLRQNSKYQWELAGDKPVDPDIVKKSKDLLQEAAETAHRSDERITRELDNISLYAGVLADESLPVFEGTRTLSSDAPKDKGRAKIEIASTRDKDEPIQHISTRFINNDLKSNGFDSDLEDVRVNQTIDATGYPPKRELTVKLRHSQPFTFTYDPKRAEDPSKSAWVLNKGQGEVNESVLEHVLFQVAQAKDMYLYNQGAFRNALLEEQRKQEVDPDVMKEMAENASSLLYSRGPMNGTRIIPSEDTSKELQRQQYEMEISKATTETRTDRHAPLDSTTTTNVRFGSTGPNRRSLPSVEITGVSVNGSVERQMTIIYRSETGKETPIRMRQNGRYDWELAPDSKVDQATAKQAAELMKSGYDARKESDRNLNDQLNNMALFGSRMTDGPTGWGDFTTRDDSPREYRHSDASLHIASNQPGRTVAEFRTGRDRIVTVEQSTPTEEERRAGKQRTMRVHTDNGTVTFTQIEVRNNSGERTGNFRWVADSNNKQLYDERALVQAVDRLGKVKDMYLMNENAQKRYRTLELLKKEEREKNKQST